MCAHAITVLNAMALALQDYKWATGTASSLFGGAYYGLSALLTFGMGALHNETLIPMPLYFLVIGLSMFFVFRTQILTTKPAQFAH
jgi:MFS transporter, DHA1 family, multidrug resistance protein